MPSSAFDLRIENGEIVFSTSGHNMNPRQTDAENGCTFRHLIMAAQAENLLPQQLPGDLRITGGVNNILHGVDSGNRFNPLSLQARAMNNPSVMEPYGYIVRERENPALNNQPILFSFRDPAAQRDAYVQLMGQVAEHSGRDAAAMRAWARQQLSRSAEPQRQPGMSAIDPARLSPLKEALGGFDMQETQTASAPAAPGKPHAGALQV